MFVKVKEARCKAVEAMVLLLGRKKRGHCNNFFSVSLVRCCCPVWSGPCVGVNGSGNHRLARHELQASRGCLAGWLWLDPPPLNCEMLSGATLGVVPNPISLARLGTGHLPLCLQQTKTSAQATRETEMPKKNIQHGMLEQAIHGVMIVGLKLPPNCRRPQAGWSHHLPSSESRLSEVFEQPTTAEDFQGRNGNRELSPRTPFFLTMDHHTSNKRSNGSNT